MSPEELAEIEARLKAAQGDDGTLALTADEYGHVWYADGDACVYVRGSLGLGINGSELARLLAHAPTDIAALLSEVRRLTPAPKVARAHAAKVAVWGPVRGTLGVAALRVNKRIKAHYSGRDGSWWAYTNGVAHARRVNSEAEARAHIEAWAKAKGWEVRDARGGDRGVAADGRPGSPADVYGSAVGGNEWTTAADAIKRGAGRKERP